MKKVLILNNLILLQITSLSRVNHKNFVNLLGYCQEEQPFTRMMVFEYAPNGTLFEHLHGNYWSFVHDKFMSSA
jgi:serine/threonine protein kinase